MAGFRTHAAAWGRSSPPEVAGRRVKQPRRARGAGGRTGAEGAVQDEAKEVSGQEGRQGAAAAGSLPGRVKDHRAPIDVLGVGRDERRGPAGPACGDADRGWPRLPAERAQYFAEGPRLQLISPVATGSSRSFRTPRRRTPAPSTSGLQELVALASVSQPSTARCRLQERSPARPIHELPARSCRGARLPPSACSPLLSDVDAKRSLVVPTSAEDFLPAGLPD